ncbi:hypothetical protein BGZ83_008328 [Gryganskiella cystojenkinii]|nr:hypothetical protein BGZ83_008328 [Gryganskiella cystojenkinii]
MASPRRSHRGGHAKSRKKEEEEEDDGGLTRCVCKQQHHEGVMIQCETCKVWQHCPCVGLGDGEVTPDKYYCDSCRPQNHPYRVQNGVLISNNQKKIPPQPSPSSATSSHKQKTATATKKRSTMNSKDASIWSDQDHQDLSDSQEHHANGTTRGSKRRRKTESTSEDEDPHRGKNNTHRNQDRNGVENEDCDEDTKAGNDDENHNDGDLTDAAGTDDDQDSPSPPPPPPPGRRSHKRAKSPPAKGKRPSTKHAIVSRSSSPAESSKPTANRNGHHRVGNSKNARPAEDVSSLVNGKESILPSTKRRKVTNGVAHPREESSSVEDNNDVEYTVNTTKSRKGNASSRQSKRIEYASEPEDNHNDSQHSPPETTDSPLTKATATTSSHRVTSSNPPTPHTPAKRAFGKKGVDRNHHHHTRSGSPHLIPGPGDKEHTPTPQPLPPAPPAPVRYPSPKMTVQDMAKRAKQLLEYIGRVQIDMAERRSRSLTNSPARGVSQQLKLEKINSEGDHTPSSSVMDTPLLSTPPQSVHEHCPSDSTTDLLCLKIGLHSEDVAMDDHRPQLQARFRPGSADTDSIAGDNKEPITPPPQGLGLTNGISAGGGGAHGLDGNAGNHSPASSSNGELVLNNKASVTSLELMDKLSGDLIRFQESTQQFARCPLILRQRPPDELTDLLDAAFDVFPEHIIDKKQKATNKDGKPTEKKADPKEQTGIREQNQDQDQLQDQDLIKRRGIDYLSYTRIFSFENVVFKHFGRYERWDHPARLLDYALKSSATGAMATEYGQGDHDQDLLFPSLKIMSMVFASQSQLTLGLPINMGHFRQAALATSIRRDLTWVFCSPVMENVEVLTIPLSDIDRYLACVSEFRSLINVSFLMDEFLAPSIVLDMRTNMFHGNNGAGIFGQSAMGGPPVDQGLEVAKRAMITKLNQQFKTMFEFLIQHLVHFPKQLQRADCPPNLTWPQSVTRCPKEILEELQSLLPVANRVSIIDYTNLIQVTSHIQETNLESVEEIKLQRSEPHGAAHKLMIKNLNRCRGLKRLSAQYPGPGAFKWAVEDRLAWDRHHASVAATAAAIRTRSEIKSVHSSVPPVLPPLPLVPLETICIHTPTKQDLDDIVFAFGATLKDLSATVGPPEFHLQAKAAEKDNAVAGQPITPVFLDFQIAAEPCWSQLSALTKISLDAMERIRFVIEPDFFTSLVSSRTNCTADQGFHINFKDENIPSSDNEDKTGNNSHKLESLRIVDSSGGPYRCQDIHNCEPFLEPSPKITHIELVGYPALVFHPDSLLQTPNLHQLRLGPSMHHISRFIPPVEELKASFRDISDETLLSPIETPALGHRAAWTWDWRLPHLKLLELSGEFAFLFKFQMLVSCPSLESLNISIYTKDGLHKRVLSVQDFMTKSSVSNSDNENGHQSEFITALSLKELTLIGPWFLNDETIQVMYGCSMNRTAVFPKLTRLSETIISAGYSLKVWLALMQGLPDLKTVYCGLYDQSEVGPEILKNHYGLIAQPMWVTGPDGRSTLEKTVPLKDTVYHFCSGSFLFSKDAAERIS